MDDAASMELLIHDILQEEIAKRRSQLVDKAHERAASREAERQRLVSQLRDLQFKESCDAVRTKQSHQRQLECRADQKQQVALLLSSIQSNTGLTPLRNTPLKIDKYCKEGFVALSDTCSNDF